MRTSVDRFTSVLVVSLGAMSGIFVGLVAQAIVAARFGAGPHLDAFYVALVVPNTLVTVIIGSSNLIFLPIFTELREVKGEPAAWRVACELATFLSLLLLLLSALILVFAPDIIGVIASGLDLATQHLAARLVRLLVPMILLSGLNAISVSILHIYGRFSRGVVSAFVASIVYIIILIAITSDRSVDGLAIALVSYYLAAFIGQVLALWDLRSFWTSPGLSLRDPNLRELMRYWTILMSSGFLRRFNPVVERYFGAQAGPASVSYLSYAGLIIRPINNLFLKSVATVLFPAMAREFATDQPQEARTSMGLAIRMNGFLIIPLIVGIVILRVPLVRLLLERGAFDTGHTSEVARVLAVFTGLLFASMISEVTSKALYALKAVRFLAALSLYNIATLVLLNLALIPRFGFMGIALATVVSLNVSWPLQLAYLRRRLGPLGLGQIASSFLAFAILAGAMAMAVLTSYRFMLDLVEPLNNILALFVSIGIGASLYLGGAWVLRLEEAKIIEANIRRLFMKYAQSVPSSTPQ